MNLLELFCDVDDFFKSFSEKWHKRLLSEGIVKRLRSNQLSESEIMTIVIHFHQSSYRNFKSYYTKHVLTCLKSEFPNLVSYNRFVELMPRVTISYKKQVVGKHRLDIVVDGKIVLELKAVSELTDLFKQRVLSYLKATGLKLGILINFGTPRVQYTRIVT